MKKIIKTDFLLIKNKDEYNEFINLHLTNQQQKELVNSAFRQPDSFFIGSYLGFKHKIYNECLKKKYKLNFDLLQEEYIDFLYDNTSAKQKWSYETFKNNYEKENLNDIKKQIKLIQFAISYFKIKKNIITYRFCSEEEIENLTIKKTTKYPCFLSTTLLPKEYKKTQQYSRYKIIKIYIPKNSKGLPTPAITKTTPEYEILFPYNSKLKYLGTEKDYRLNQELEAFLLSN